MGDDSRRTSPPTLRNPLWTETFDDKPLGAKQSAVLHIPKPRTTLNLGEWGKDLDWADIKSPFGFPGVSLSTEASLFFDVAKSTLLNLTGGVLLQTKASWQQWSDHHMLLRSKRSLRLFAQERLFIGTLKPSEKKAEKPEGERQAEAIPKPGETDKLEEHHAAKLNETNEPEESYARSVKEISEKVEGLFKYLGWMKQVVFFSPWHSLEKFGKFGIPKLINLAVDRTGKEEKGSAALELHGEEGISVTSPAEIAAGSMEAVKVFGAKEVAISAGAELALHAGMGATIFGGVEVGIDAGGYAELRAGREVGIAALHGPVEIKGHSIEIGKEVPAVGKNRILQAATSSVEVNANEEIKLVANAPGNPQTSTSVHLLADKIEIGAPEKDRKRSLPALAEALIGHIPEGVRTKASEWFPKSEPRTERAREVAVEASEKIEIRVGDYLVRVAPTGITIGEQVAGSHNPKVFLRINKDKIELFKKNQGIAIDGEVAQLGHGDACIKASRSGNTLTFSGRKINIG